MDAGMLDNWKGVCFLGTQMQTFWLWKTAAAEEEDPYDIITSLFISMFV